MSIFSDIDAQRRSAENLESSFVKQNRQIVWNLSSHRDDDAYGVFLAINFHYGFKTQLLEVELVALVIIRTHGLGVIIDDNRLVI